MTRKFLMAALSTLLMCASAYAQELTRGAGSSMDAIPDEVYLAVIEAAADRLASQVDPPLHVASEDIPPSITADKLRPFGFEIRSRCDGGINFQMGTPATPASGIWVVDVVTSLRGGTRERRAAGHDDKYIVRCDEQGCSATGGHGIGALLMVGSGPCVDKPLVGTPVSLDRIGGCGGVAGEVRIADNPGGVLRGASVRLAGSMAGAVTDRDGRFLIPAGRVGSTPSGDELHVVRLGYRPVTVPITLHPDSATLVRVAMPKSMPRPEWQREPEVEVEIRSCRPD
jgi:hypothetical protein